METSTDFVYHLKAAAFLLLAAARTERALSRFISSIARIPAA
ncbi:hypothetical protein FTUN_2362 [Frigoriglobus tundricola]|uniref:Uncharacterized protein n=1 Tax=Frigoriglobus tundricola TaxID=2774151 RepID=A0A6M5YNC5_9BACT|nr:hypothetical protein FTUN_2362 [Frigoriglobus tundricola]